MRDPLTRFFWAFVFPRWRLGLGVFLAGLGAGAASLPFPLLLRRVIDEVAPRGDWRGLLTYGLLLLGLVLAESLLSYVAQALAVRGGESILYQAQYVLTAHVLRLPHPFLQE